MKVFGNKKRRSDTQRPRQYTQERSDLWEQEAEDTALWDQPQSRPAPRPTETRSESRRQPEERSEARRPAETRSESRRQPEERAESRSRKEEPPQDMEDESDGVNGRRKAIFLLAASICVFICATVMCLVLIAQSADGLELPPEAQVDTQAKELTYVVNAVQPSSAEVPSDMQAPVSLYDADHLNFLLIGWDKTTKRTDTLLIASVHLETGELALLSIPRDTYISGNYETPKINLVYGEAEDGKGRGVKATREMVKSMIGFEPDYYFVLDEATLSLMTELAGGVEFTVPDSPDYSALSAGNQQIDGKKAMQLLSYRDDYTDVETEPSRVQREFLLTLLNALLKDENAYEENAQRLAAVAETDLTAGELTYLAYLLRNADTTAVISRALPGGEIEIDDVSYYEVDPERAIELLNAHFNPLKTELTVYDVNFRQETGDSGSGEYDPYGFGNNGNGNTSDSSEETEESTEDSTDDTSAPTEGPDTTDPTDPTDTTDSTDSSDATDATDAPIDTPPETEPPAEPPASPDEP